MANEKNIAQKQAKVEEVVELLKNAQSVVVIDYRGLLVEEVTALRVQYRAADVHYEVIKNGIVERAAAQLGLTELLPHLVGPSAFAICAADAVAPAKITSEFIKKTKKMQIKCGIVNGKVVDAAGIEMLSSMPPREVLLAQVLGTLNAPITGFVSVCGGIIRSLLYTLKAVEEKKAK